VCFDPTTLLMDIGSCRAIYDLEGIFLSTIIRPVGPLPPPHPHQGLRDWPSDKQAWSNPRGRRAERVIRQSESGLAIRLCAILRLKCPSGQGEHYFVDNQRFISAAMRSRPASPSASLRSCPNGVLRASAITSVTLSITLMAALLLVNPLTARSLPPRYSVKGFEIIWPCWFCSVQPHYGFRDRQIQRQACASPIWASDRRVSMALVPPCYRGRRA
jgi:hypothetical protein